MVFVNYNTGGASSCDQWLVTPQITNLQSTAQLKFWMRKFGTYIDHVKN